MPISSEQVVADFIERIDRLLQGAKREISDLLAPDATLEVIGSTPLSGIYRGGEEILNVFARTAMRRIASGSIRQLDSIAAGEEVGVFLLLRAVTPEGAVYNEQGDPSGCYFRTERGKIVEVRLFLDTTEVETKLYGRRFVGNKGTLAGGGVTP